MLKIVPQRADVLMPTCVYLSASVVTGIPLKRPGEHGPNAPDVGTKSVEGGPFKMTGIMIFIFEADASAPLEMALTKPASVDGAGRHPQRALAGHLPLSPMPGVCLALLRPMKDPLAVVNAGLERAFVFRGGRPLDLPVAVNKLFV